MEFIYMYELQAHLSDEFTECKGLSMVITERQRRGHISEEEMSKFFLGKLNVLVLKLLQVIAQSYE